MTTLKAFVQAVTSGEVVEPFWVKNEATKRDDMGGHYREVIDYFATFDSVQMRARLGTDFCTDEDCPGVTTEDAEGNKTTNLGLVRGVESRVPGAFRSDWCCLVCGKSETHRAGWLDAKTREEYRAKVGSVEVG